MKLFGKSIFMNKRFLSSLNVCILLLTTIPLKAESASIDFLRSTGKIYSVIAVIVVVLIGIAIFLYRIDQKLNKLENQINNEQ